MDAPLDVAELVECCDSTQSTLHHNATSESRLVRRLLGVMQSADVVSK